MRAQDTTSAETYVRSDCESSPLSGIRNCPLGRVPPSALYSAMQMTLARKATVHDTYEE